MARLDLNLRPAVASKALEWCRQRVEEGDTDEHRRHHDHPEVLLLEEDIARLKEELQKIQPFRRDLSSIVAVVAYVIKHLEEEVVAPLKDRADADVVSDLSSDVVEVEDQRRIATAAWLDSSDLRRGCDANANANANAKVGGETMKNKQEVPPGKECCCFTALALSTPAPLDQRPIVNVPRLAFDVQKQQQPCRHRRRKSRRCWSRELHRRFVDALDKLGGPQVATPRHIRELMKYHGLTNDEVKSHLQKYRLRVKKKKPSSAQVSGKHQPLPFSDHCSTDSNEVGDLEIESDGWRSVQNQRLREEFAV